VETDIGEKGKGLLSVEKGIASSNNYWLVPTEVPIIDNAYQENADQFIGNNSFNRFREC
jgi:hypothetical protein